MKRFIAVLLALIFLASLTFANAESTSKAEGKFKPTFVKTIGKNQSALQWMFSESNRALFAVLFAFDFMNEYQENLDKAPYDFRDLLYGDMYVGRSLNTLSLLEALPEIEKFASSNGILLIAEKKVSGGDYIKFADSNGVIDLMNSEKYEGVLSQEHTNLGLLEVINAFGSMGN